MYSIPGANSCAPTLNSKYAVSEVAVHINAHAYRKRAFILLRKFEPLKGSYLQLDTAGLVARKSALDASNHP